MKFKGTIIITDPCYIAKDEDWGTLFSYEYNTIDESTGITDYLMESTGSGDGEWSVYKLNYPTKITKLKTLLENIYEDEDFENKLIGDNCGSFAADAGMSGVYYLDEVLKYNPDFENELEHLKEVGCLAIIEKFDGDVIPFFDNSDQLHFIGIGNNVSFYTV